MGGSKALRWIGIGLATVAGLILIAVITLALAFFGRLEQSKPRLKGNVAAQGLGAAVRIDRDAAGVPTITGTSRADVAYATGYLHAQERFFQMDLMRRSAAGELGALVGSAALSIDAKTRLHLFRARARVVLVHMSPAERALLDAYVAGVNRGLGDLKAPPFEYMILRQKPVAWRAEDSLLCVYAMYLDLQGAKPELDLDRARAAARVGPEMADLLYPTGTELDASLDGSILAPPALPAGLPVVANDATAANDAPEPPKKGSNNWAVAGKLTATGGAMVANDMHLGIRMPNTWYRARLVISGQMDIVGVTLPGMFPIVVGSNGHVAWGLTVAFVDTHDAVAIDPVPGKADWYRTPAGPRAIAVRHETLCAGGACRDYPVRQTIWGPIVARLPDGREAADHWVAHGVQAMKLEPFLALERAQSVAEALPIAHRMALPEQNLMIGDSAGHIAWTVMGQIPHRFGFDGRQPQSWADGKKGWAGYYGAGEIPTVLDPSSNRLWSANSRQLGGDALSKIGDGGYDDGSRATEIRRRLFARDHFAERDMLSIQLDTTAPRIFFWRDQMLAALQRHRGDPRLAAMIDPVKAWDGRADVTSVGYRLIRTFRFLAIRNAYNAYVGKPEDTTLSSYAGASAEETMRLLLRARPPRLVPPGSQSWEAFVAGTLDDLVAQVDEQAEGKLDKFTWGDFMTVSVRHPLAQAIPMLGWLTDSAAVPMPGDNGVIRAQGKGFGSSERIVVTPGHEAQGIFHMPGGQSGAPLAPYYLVGNKDWVEGRATPLLPGPTKWTLTLTP